MGHNCSCWMNELCTSGARTCRDIRRTQKGETVAGVWLSIEFDLSIDEIEFQDCGLVGWKWQSLNWWLLLYQRCTVRNPYTLVLCVLIANIGVEFMISLFLTFRWHALCAPEASQCSPIWFTHTDQNLGAYERTLCPLGPPTQLIRYRPSVSVRYHGMSVKMQYRGTANNMINLPAHTIHKRMKNWIAASDTTHY